MISDLTDSDGMGWTDFDGRDDTKDDCRIDHLWQSDSQLVGFEANDTLSTDVLGADDDDVDVAGFNKAVGHDL